MSKIFNKQNLILVAAMLLVSTNSVVAMDTLDTLMSPAVPMSPALGTSVVPSPVEATARALKGSKKRKGIPVPASELGFKVVSTGKYTAAAAHARTAVTLKKVTSPARATALGSVPTPERVTLVARSLAGMTVADARTKYYAADVKAVEDASDSENEGTVLRGPKKVRRGKASGYESASSL